MKLKISTISAPGDNFIYLAEYEPGKAFVVDPGQSAPVGHELQRRDLALAMILVTHHHYDHIAGVSDLRKRWPCKVIGPDTRVPTLDIVAEETPEIAIGKRKIEVMVTPGHTATGLSYYIPPLTESEAGMVFTGDTMFIGGCGRVMENDMETMYRSLKSIAALPDETLLYPGHDYTEENYRFALTVDAKNEAVQNQLANISKTRIPPSTIAMEKQTNVFLLAKSAAAFAKLRRKKDVF